jgi:two-component system, cell cycle sensor histidine kinase and response regulator CckA
MNNLPIGHGELILVIDDESSILEIIRFFLESLNYNVLTADNGREAIALYTENKDVIKAILLDNDLPVINGEKTFKIITSMSSDVKIIIMSGSSCDELKQKYKTAHAFIPKPFEFRNLLIVLDEVLK